jgi:hypothetical protein
MLLHDCFALPTRAHALVHVLVFVGQPRNAEPRSTTLNQVNASDLLHSPASFEPPDVRDGYGTGA